MRIESILEEAYKNLKEKDEKKIIDLKVPRGSGKTMGSLNFAVNHFKNILYVSEKMIGTYIKNTLKDTMSSNQDNAIKVATQLHIISEKNDVKFMTQDNLISELRGISLGAFDCIIFDDINTSNSDWYEGELMPWLLQRFFTKTEVFFVHTDEIDRINESLVDYHVFDYRFFPEMNDRIKTTHFSDFQKGKFQKELGPWKHESSLDLRISNNKKALHLLNTH